MNIKKMNTKKTRKHNQQKWPVDYRLEYKLPDEEMTSHKYCSALDDAQAMDIFNEMFAHGDGKYDDRIVVIFERYDRYAENWNKVEPPVDKLLI